MHLGLWLFSYYKKLRFLVAINAFLAGYNFGKVVVLLNDLI